MSALTLTFTLDRPGREVAAGRSMGNIYRPREIRSTEKGFLQKQVPYPLHGAMARHRGDGAVENSRQRVAAAKQPCSQSDSLPSEWSRSE